MEKISALMVICAGNSPVIGEFPAQRPVTRNKRLSKQWWGWRFETPSRPLWRHNNVIIWFCNVKVELVQCCDKTANEVRSWLHNWDYLGLCWFEWWGNVLCKHDKRLIAIVQILMYIQRKLTCPRKWAAVVFNNRLDVHPHLQSACNGVQQTLACILPMISRL